MTPTFARMVGARANALRKPVRWFSVPQLFRYERQQRGRLREHFQLNVDIVGESDVTADAELLAVAVDMMRTFGLTHEDVRARVSDRRLLAALLLGMGVTEAQLPAAYQAIDKAERDARDVLVARLEEAGVEPERAGRALDLARPTTAGRCAPSTARRGSRGPRSTAWTATSPTSRRSARRVGDARPHHRARARLLHGRGLRAVRRPRRVPGRVRRGGATTPSSAR
jgi:histidyl-tRNA synthetase